MSTSDTPATIRRARGLRTAAAGSANAAPAIRVGTNSGGRICETAVNQCAADCIPKTSASTGKISARTGQARSERSLGTRSAASTAAKIAVIKRATGSPRSMFSALASVALAYWQTRVQRGRVRPLSGFQ
jgi:hypothetical protein